MPSRTQKPARARAAAKARPAPPKAKAKPAAKAQAKPAPRAKPVSKPGKPPTKKVQKRALMSKQQNLTRAELSIMARMAQLDPGSVRYQMLESALAFKASWVLLGESLASVQTSGAFRGWGYASFERFVADELFLTATTAKKLVRSFTWLGEEAPEVLPPRDGVRFQVPSKNPPPPLPDFKAVDVMAQAKQDLDAERLPEEAYLSLKQAALDGQMTAGQLKKTLKDAIPDHLKVKAPIDKVRHLRRALTSCVKVIDGLREWAEPVGDEDIDDASEALVVLAEELRDQIALRLPRDGDTGAEGTADGGLMPPDLDAV